MDRNEIGLLCALLLINSRSNDGVFRGRERDHPRDAPCEIKWIRDGGKIQLCFLHLRLHSCWRHFSYECVKSRVAPQIFEFRIVLHIKFCISIFNRFLQPIQGFKFSAKT